MKKRQRPVSQSLTCDHVLFQSSEPDPELKVPPNSFITATDDQRSTILDNCDELEVSSVDSTFSSPERKDSVSSVANAVQSLPTIDFDATQGSDSENELDDDILRYLNQLASNNIPDNKSEQRIEKPKSVALIIPSRTSLLPSQLFAGLFYRTTTAAQGPKNFIHSLDPEEKRLVLNMHEYYSNKWQERFLNTRRSLLHDSPSLRLTIYEKFLVLYEQYFNDQDFKNMEQVLLRPSCSTDVHHEIKMWTRSSNESNHLSSSICRQSNGVQGILYALSDICRKLPDSILVYPHDMKTRHDPDKGTFVCSPFTHFCTFAMHSTQQDSSSTSASSSVIANMKTFDCTHGPSLCSCTTSPSKLPVTLVEVEISGYSVVHFDVNDIVIRIHHNIFLSRSNDPTVSTETLWNHLCGQCSPDSSLLPI